MEGRNKLKGRGNLMRGTRGVGDLIEELGELEE